jgi:hypothetical protein
MPLTLGEKARISYHLGYPALTDAASLQFGVPAFSQTNFLVQNALNRIQEPMLEQVRSISNIMDGIELQLVSAQGRLRAEKLEELTLRKDECDSLEGEYRRWGYRLSDIVGSPIYPFSMRYRGSGSMSVTSVPIHRAV